MKPASDIFSPALENNEDEMEKNEARAKILELSEELRRLRDHQRLQALEELRDRLFAAHERLTEKQFRPHGKGFVALLISTISFGINMFL